MNYGLYTAAGGMLTGMYRQDVLANNLANINTPGFKPDIVGTVHRDAARIEDGLMHLPSNAMLERLGGGILMAPNRVSLEQGTLQRTEGSLDLAIEGEGFFVVSSGSGTDTERFRLSRDGRLTLGRDGVLVQAASGLPVMDAQDRPIRLDPAATVTVGPGGEVAQDGVVVAQLQVTAVPDPAGLRKAGDNLFLPTAEALGSRRPAEGRVRQGHIERSAVDPIRMMMQVTNAGNGVGSNGRMVQLFDELLGRTFSTFAKLA